MEYSRKILNKFSKEISKMRQTDRLKLLESVSKNRLDFYRPVVTPNNGDKLFKYQTHELATIALFSIVIEDSFVSKTISKTRWLVKNSNIVREQTDYLGYLFDSKIEYAVAALFYQQMFLKQFVIMFYRSNFLYNYSEKVNVKDCFLKTFNCDYNEFIDLFAITLGLFKVTDTSELLDILKQKTPNALSALTIDPKSFKNKYEPFHKWRDISLINFNYLNRYPFIELSKDEVFVPFWPSIPYACSESLMFDVTRSDDKLKRDIGKFAFEDYVFHITKSSLTTKGSRVEKEFTYTKQKLKSSDLIIISESNVLFVEVKFKNFKLDLRVFENELVQRYEDELSDHIVQVYKNIKALIMGRMRNEILPESIERVSGIVVLLDDYYISLSNVFDLALDKIKKLDDSITLDQLTKTIMICPLYEYEKILYYSNISLIKFVNKVLDKQTHVNDKQYINESNAVKGIININEVNDFHIDILQRSRSTLEDYIKIKENSEQRR